MMHLRRIAPAAWAIFSLFIISETAFAKGKSDEAKARHFGIGKPKTVQELPNGKFRKNLERLSPKAKGKALKWLQGFEFPSEDVASLRVNSVGEISYADNFVPDDDGASSSSQSSSEFADISAEQAFQLHSRPGSSNVVYLDFDGHVIEGTAWSSNKLVALPFDPSGNDSPATEANFTQDELNTIHEIWHRVSEDFAAFNIDVTTEEPAVFTSTTGRVLFTHHTDASGQTMPYNTSGGVAYVNVFGLSDYATRYSPALIYYTNLAERSVGLLNYNAEVASHEFGHNLGLSHDGDPNNTYYPGHGSGLVSWGPIMGMMLDKNVTQWSKGEYPNANNSEDDLAIIAGELGYVGDDHGDSAAQATALLVESNGDILVSSPELDPDNLLPENKGVIDDRADSDWFYLDVSEAGSISITATPAWHSFTRNDSRGSNLDIELALFDANLTLLDLHDPNDDTSATVSASLSSGRYYLQVDGVGNSVNSDYSDYASTGMYFLEGYVDASVTPPEVDSTPPSPTTMSWHTNPHATGESSIAMTAVEATDESGTVEYLFICVAGEKGCTDSGWQSNRTYTAFGLEPGAYYEFKVKARDKYDNQTSASNSVGVNTDSPPPQIENIAPEAIASYASELAVITKGKSVEVLLDGSASYDQDGTIIDWTWTDEQGNILGSDEQLSLRLKEGTYQYSLTVTDNEGATDSTSLTVKVTKSEGSNKGKPPKG